MTETQIQERIAAAAVELRRQAQEANYDAPYVFEVDAGLERIGVDGVVDLRALVLALAAP